MGKRGQYYERIQHLRNQLPYEYEHKIAPEHWQEKKKISDYIQVPFYYIGLCIAGFTAVTGLNTSVALTKQTYTQVQVSSGDTLWTIANAYKDENTDTRKAVYEICQVNDIEASDLHPGMVLEIPEDL